MNYRGSITTDIERLLELFSRHCADRDALDELLVVVRSPSQWHTAHGLFQRIREKTLAAERSRNGTAMAQRLFEEVCAKTLYNLSGEPAPFDADSPYWVVPNAIALGRLVGVAESAVLASVSLQGERGKRDA
ncbi:MAG: hypothetical protein IV097_10290 [Burkholderiaceae bacterium]|nr:hypothetical protein [Burkholderiaceae bacterium]